MISLFFIPVIQDLTLLEDQSLEEIPIQSEKQKFFQPKNSTKLLSFGQDHPFNESSGLLVNSPQSEVNKAQREILNALQVGQGTTGFISTWKTNNPGISANNQITLPLLSTGS